MLKGFVFDLDGVITDTARFHYQAWSKIAQDDMGITINPSVNEQLKGVSRMDSLNVILKFGQRENDFTEAEKEALATKKNDYYVQLISNMTPADILPGIQAFLDQLKAEGYQMSLASASKNAPRILNGLQLTNYFDQIVDPASLHAGKPDPEIFAKGATLLGLKPTEAVGLEDAFAGIQSINGAGEFSVGIGDPAILNEADLNFTSTAEISLDQIKTAFATWAAKQ
ncbi:beta-phosphoglucomutase [Lapidilactobacillus achengensis]|uniref:Beta-phosphoglucomutase n=1 Tax=Lapidilactobacillus achengensis TaxID=2486000 RepID=A0ABW1UMN4_9LACO|nr:beta-phosphoglucomutase [Lapidilactobacillus achengensis]